MGFAGLFSRAWHFGWTWLGRLSDAIQLTGGCGMTAAGVWASLRSFQLAAVLALVIPGSALLLCFFLARVLAHDRKVRGLNRPTNNPSPNRGSESSGASAQAVSEDALREAAIIYHIVEWPLISDPDERRALVINWATATYKKLLIADPSLAARFGDSHNIATVPTKPVADWKTALVGELHRRATLLNLPGSNDPYTKAVSELRKRREEQATNDEAKRRHAEAVAEAKTEVLNAIAGRISERGIRHGISPLTIGGPREEPNEEDVKFARAEIERRGLGTPPPDYMLGSSPAECIGAIRQWLRG